MREIKFRAWEKVLHRMISDEHICRNLDGEWYAWVEVSPNDRAMTDRIILMEYTGLLDCHGKDIWEGDVLLDKGFDYDHQHTADCFGSNKERICEPYYLCYYRVAIGNFQYGHWSGVGVYATRKREGNGVSIQPIDPEWEVAGNIYEHPELLE